MVFNGVFGNNFEKSIAKLGNIFRLGVFLGSSHEWLDVFFVFLVAIDTVDVVINRINHLQLGLLFVEELGESENAVSVEKSDEISVELV